MPWGPTVPQKQREGVCAWDAALTPRGRVVSCCLAPWRAEGQRRGHPVGTAITETTSAHTLWLSLARGTFPAALDFFPLVSDFAFCFLSATLLLKTRVSWSQAPRGGQFAERLECGKQRAGFPFRPWLSCFLVYPVLGTKPWPSLSFSKLAAF